jgi:hypothetical protein
LIEWVIKYGQNPPPSNRQYQNSFSLTLPPSVSGELLEEEIAEDLRVYLSQLNVKDLRTLAGQRDVKISGLKKKLSWINWQPDYWTQSTWKKLFRNYLLTAAWFCPSLLKA